MWSTQSGHARQASNFWLRPLVFDFPRGQVGEIGQIGMTTFVFRVAGDVCSAIDQDGGKPDPYCLGRRGSRNLFGVG